MGLFTHLTRSALFLDALQEECLAPLAITFADYSVLRVLEYEGPKAALTPTRLADILVRTTGGMTKTIDRLERRGVVSRGPDPTDRRGVLVRLTPRGRRLCQRASDAYAVGRQRILAGLDDDEIERIDTALRHLVAVFEQDRRDRT
ncbi:MarR family winged helix-turn-helix transcriptional regulator [Rhabdothermincola salaria]|uniref:MarR family winged helix-turn-helix transcriptional regulator n=1 Tax=Rhabdothermincola salaria TaxID=2903142 RepID=UPI001E2B0B7D|nr:MarR family transcriptional regulator [Rhabdothermincola salaria]MCD9622889.1 MarR family transcriptional regulator [Rhabdothermincola salaria]